MTEEEKRVLIEEARADAMRLAHRQLADLTAATDAEAARLQSELLEAMRERDEARIQVKAWQSEELERRRERNEARAQLAALREAARSMREKHDAELEEWALAAGGQRNDRLAAERGRDEAIASAERAEAQLAALREAAREVLIALEGSGAGDTLGAACRGLLGALVSATSAEAYTRRVRAEALREAADEIESRGEATRHPWMLGPSAHNPSGTVLTEAGAARCDEARWLRARADEIERGER